MIDFVLYASVLCMTESNHILPEFAVGIECDEIKRHVLQNIGNLITLLSCPCGMQEMTWESFVHEQYQDYIGHQCAPIHEQMILMN